MVPAVAALAALAMDRARWPRPRLEPLLAVAAGAACAAAVPLFLWLTSALGAPEWPRFLPAEQRLAFTRSYSGAYSSEHTPGTAVAAGWGEVTAGAPPPHAVPVPPAGTLRLPDGFLVPQARRPLPPAAIPLPGLAGLGCRRAGAAAGGGGRLHRGAAGPAGDRVAHPGRRHAVGTPRLGHQPGDGRRAAGGGITHRPGRAARHWRLTTRLREAGAKHGAGLPERY